VPIKELYDRYNRDLTPLFKGRTRDVTEENIQARIRGNILMAISNKEGSMVLSTGNKSELAHGILHALRDMSGGLAHLRLAQDARSMNCPVTSTQMTRSSRRIR